MDDILKTAFFDPNEPDRDRDPHPPQLLTLDGLSPGKVYPLDGSRFRVGRIPGNEIVLPSKPVSKLHALLVQETGRFFVEDQGSTNGVLVNGVRVAPDSRRRLYHGDNIRISDHLFLFRQENSFVDGTGLSQIVLDDARIDAEVEECLADWATWKRRSRPDSSGS